MDTTPLVAYLDTCVVSGLAKGDLLAPDVDALLQILRDGKNGALRVVTSEVTASEIAGIPEEFRLKHTVIYSLLADLPAIAEQRTNPGMPLLGVGGGRREDPLLTQLKALLPDEGDAKHVFQCARNSVQFLVTVDRKSFQSRANAVEQLCGVKIVGPVEFARSQRMHVNGG
jgi:hypothetical protein